MSKIKTQRTLIARGAKQMEGKTIKGGMIITSEFAATLKALFATVEEDTIEAILAREEKEKIEEQKSLEKKAAIIKRRAEETEKRIQRHAKIIEKVEDSISTQSKRISTHTVKMGQVKRHSTLADHSKSQIQKGFATRNALKEERSIRRSNLAKIKLEARRLKHEARHFS